MTDARLFDIVKPSDFVLALSADEGTKVDCPYRVVSVWRDENGGQGITVELEDGCGAGLNQGEYEPLFRANARPMTVAEAAKVLLGCDYSVMAKAFDAMDKMQGEGADNVMAAALRAISEDSQ